MDYKLNADTIIIGRLALFDKWCWTFFAADYHRLTNVTLSCRLSGEYPPARNKFLTHV